MGGKSVTVGKKLTPNGLLFCADSCLPPSHIVVQSDIQSQVWSPGKLENFLNTKTGDYIWP